MIALIHDTGDVARLRGRWVRLRWSQSFLGQPVRLLLRFHRRDGSTERHLLPAAVFGRARWIGPAPDDLVRLELLAVIADPAAIRIDAVEPTTLPRLALEALRRAPARALVAGLRWPLRNHRGRMLAMQGLLDHAPVSDIARFAESRARQIEPDGLDRAILRPPPDASLSIVLACGDGDEPALARTLESLSGVAAREVQIRIGAADAAARDRIAGIAQQLGLAGWAEIAPYPPGLGRTHAALALAAEAATEWVVPLEPGDTLVREAVPVVLDAVTARPHLAFAYADSVLRGGDRTLAAELKPDWSPAFLEAANYVGRPVVMRRTLLARAAASILPDDPDPWWTLLRRAGSGLTREEVGHIRRALLARAPTSAPPSRRAQRSSPEPPSAGAWVASSASPPRDGEVAVRSVSIVIPTRDRLDLLRRAVRSIRRFTSPGSYQLIVVDNGSRDPDALAYLASLRTETGILVIEEPGPFNFSHLVNRGVAAARGEVVLLLNNDCEILEDGWLPALAGAAAGAEVGAVGALLLYADGTLQHAGIGIGLGGEAGHRDRRRPRHHPGNLGRLRATHEVSAVTAACLAVARERYLEVGGFDAAFAVAFNDVDFCLRLDVAGYRNLLVPGAVVRHAESASRGRDVDGAKRARFRAEAELFASRWQHRMLDDPYTHPLFGLNRFADTLA